MKGFASRFGFAAVGVVALLMVAQATYTREQRKQLVAEDSSAAKPSFRLENVRRLTDDGGYLGATWSPASPATLAFVNTEGTFIFSLSENKLSKLGDEPAGFKFFWTRDGQHLVYRIRIDDQSLAIRQFDVSTGTVSTLVESSDLSLPQEVEAGTLQYRDRNTLKKLDVKKTVSSSSSTLPRTPFAYQLNDQIFVDTNGQPVQITTGAGQYFLPHLSPDGSKVLYQELSRGLYVIELQTGTTVHLGPGDDAAWSPDGQYVIFELTDDDGSSIVSSELYLADTTGQRIKLTDTLETIEMRPAWSPDGKHISFDANGSIFVADIVSER